MKHTQKNGCKKKVQIRKKATSTTYQSATISPDSDKSLFLENAKSSTSTGPKTARTNYPMQIRNWIVPEILEDVNNTNSNEQEEQVPYTFYEYSREAGIVKKSLTVFPGRATPEFRETRSMKIITVKVASCAKGILRIGAKELKLEKEVGKEINIPPDSVFQFTNTHKETRMHCLITYVFSKKD